MTAMCLAPQAIMVKEFDQAVVYRVMKLVNDANEKHLWFFSEEYLYTYGEAAQEMADSDLLLLELDGEVVGTVVLHYEGEVLRLKMLAVARAYQGQGLGTRLLQIAGEVARSRHASSLRLIAIAETGGIGFYLRRGFRVVSEVRESPGVWGAIAPFNLAVMEKEVVQ
jgi:GNAT superfamily N-acetyltransferase